MPQCRTALPLTSQLHPALLLPLLKWETSLFLLVVISTTHVGTCPWMPVERKMFPICWCWYRVQSFTISSAGPWMDTSPAVAKRGWGPNRSFGGLGLVSGMPCSSKNDVKDVKQRALCLAYLAKNYALRKNRVEVSMKCRVKCLVASLRQRQTKLISDDLLCQKRHASDYLRQIIAKEIVPQYPMHIPDLYIMKLFLLYDL